MIMKLHKVLLKQKTTTDCGVTALRMLLAYVHKDIAYLIVALPPQLDNFLAIQKTATKFGVTLKAYEVVEYSLLGNIKAPFIMQINYHGVKHFMVGHINNGKLYVNDPAGESYVILLKDAQKLFISNILVVNYVEEVQKVAKPHIHLPYGLFVWQTAFLLCLSIGFAFLDSGALGFVSYIMFTLGALIKIGERSALLRKIASFDIHYLKPELFQTEKNFKERFTAFQSAKSIILSYPLEVFTTITTLLLISVILMLNNILLLIICAFIIITTFIETALLNKKGIAAWSLQTNENALLTVPSAKRATYYTKLMSGTTAIAKKTVYQNIIMHFIIGVFIFCLMYFTDSYRLNFLFFYFFAFSYYYYELKKIFALVQKRSNYYRALNTIIN